MKTQLEDLGRDNCW